MFWLDGPQTPSECFLPTSERCTGTGEAVHGQVKLGSQRFFLIINGDQTKARKKVNIALPFSTGTQTQFPKNWLQHVMFLVHNMSMFSPCSAVLKFRKKLVSGALYQKQFEKRISKRHHLMSGFCTWYFTYIAITVTDTGALSCQ